MLGFVGEPSEIDVIAQGIPRLDVERYDGGPNECIAVRLEEALAAEDDDLFAVLQESEQDAGSDLT